MTHGRKVQEKQMIPRIYKGDDTNFRGLANLAIRLNAETDLTGCRIEFTFLGHKRTFTGVSSDGTLPFVFTAAETALMPVGTHKAKVRVFDPQGRVKTVDDSIKIKVTDDLAEAYGGGEDQEIEVHIGQGAAGISDEDVFDCSSGMTDVKERLAYLWEKMGGTVINRDALEYGRESGGEGGIGEI